MDPIQRLTQKMQMLEQELTETKRLLADHQHDDVDGTKVLRKNINLDVDQGINIGVGGLLSGRSYVGASGDIFSLGIDVGEDRQISIVNQSRNAQVNLDHFSQTDFSYLVGARKPIVTCPEGTTIAVTVGGNTVTIGGFSFATNELAGALINIIDSSAALVETQVIASNTSSVITISGTWGASTSGATFIIYKPIFLGRDIAIWARVYVQEGTAAGGVRFGVGPTNGGQNGLLYMDAAGDLYWRNKAGSSTKLN